MHAQTLIHARWVLPIAPAHVLDHHAVAIDAGKITAIVPSAEAREQITADTVIERPHHVLIPGLVNAHTHAAMSLMRGMADDLPLQTWLEQHIWPVEGQFASAEFVRDGTRLAIAEMLMGGTTCFNDMYFFPDAVADVALAMGMRAGLGMIVLDFPTAWAANADEYISKGVDLRDERKHHDLLSFCFAPHAPYTVSDAPLERIRALSDETDTPVHMHVHETAFEVEQAAQQGARPLQRLNDLGLLNPNLAAVHMTQLEDDEIELCAQRGITVTHCPESNMKLGSGQCRTGDLLAAGVTLAIGTDGAASNNDLDMLGELRSAALLAKVTANDATALPATAALHAATLGGAQAMGLADTIGSLEPGKWADLCCIDLAHPATAPVYDPVSTVVYAASRSQVSDVWVAGRPKLVDGALQGIALPALLESAEDWRSRIHTHLQSQD